MLEHEAHRRNLVAVGKTEIAPYHALGPDDLGRVGVAFEFIDLDFLSVFAEQVVHEVRAEYELGELDRYGLIEAHFLAEGLDVLFGGIERHEDRRWVPSD